MNTSQPNSVQNSGQPAPLKLTPDFSHRFLTPSFAGCFGDVEEKPFVLADAVSDSCTQAEKTLALLQGFFIGDAQAIPSEEMMYWMLFSVRQTVKDIDAIVVAYHKANQQK